ncbi:MAG: hypothetical protein A2Y93_15425 [Chloroflexi bacterium RBG_13_68_17]|nr:MAG: hypothetical protein A2Y93_15425 [Chloroflexi bacterium RBG_13_68_17]
MRNVRFRLALPVALLLGACAPLATPTPAATRTPRPTTGPTAIPFTTWSQASPDGLWLAEGSMEGPWPEGDQEMYRATLLVRSTDRATVWTIADVTSHYGLGYTTPSIFRWSQDGRALYFGNTPVPDGCALFVNFEDLYRLDLGDGRVTELLPPTRSSVIAMSPDERSLAFTEWQETPELVLRDAGTGEERRVALGAAPDDQAGGVIWSPDETALLVTVAHSPCLPPWSHSIVWVDLATLETSVLIDHDARRFGVAEWADPARILLWDESGAGWTLDATSGELTPLP